MAHPEPGDFSPIWRTPTSSARLIVVSGGYDATVRAWDLESRELLHQPLRGHDGEVNALALGELHGRAIVASGGNDRTVRLWDLVSGESLGAALQGHRRKVRAVAIGEFRGRPIMVSGSNDNTVRVWDLDSGRLLATNHWCTTASRTIASVSCAAAFRGVRQRGAPWWTSKSACPRRLQGHAGSGAAVALGWAGGRIACPRHDKTVRVWDLEKAGPWVNRWWARGLGQRGGGRGGRPIAVSGGDDKTGYGCGTRRRPDLWVNRCGGTRARSTRWRSERLAPVNQGCPAATTTRYARGSVGWRAGLASRGTTGA
jgi:hypothetical protein